MLDSKRIEDAAVIATAPRIADFHSPEAAAHFEAVKAGLTALGVPFTVNERLVRGLDYYRRTTFEYVGGTLDSAQNALGGGGRYDGLVEQLGGKPIPACGFAMGIERLVTLVRESGAAPAPECVDVYVVHQGELAARMAPQVAEGLRSQGINVLFHCGGGNFKSQMKKADASGAAFAVIIGDDEAQAGEVTLKPLRDGDNEQQRIRVDQLGAEIMDSFFDGEEN